MLLSLFVAEKKQHVCLQMEGDGWGGGLKSNVRTRGGGGGLKSLKKGVRLYLNKPL